MFLEKVLNSISISFSNSSFLFSSSLESWREVISWLLSIRLEITGVISKLIKRKDNNIASFALKKINYEMQYSKKETS